MNKEVKIMMEKSKEIADPSSQEHRDSRLRAGETAWDLSRPFACGPWLCRWSLERPLAVGPESIPSHYIQAEQIIHPKRIGSLKSIQTVGTNPGATTKGPAICPNYTTIVTHIQSDLFGSMLVPSLSDWSCRTSISSGKLFQWVSPSWSWPLCSYSHSSHSSTGL